MADDTFRQRVERRELHLAVVGLGYVGLPLAVSYAESGFRCLGYDVDAERVHALNDGRSHIDDIADAQLAAVVDSGRFRATADAEEIGATDVVFICVPTPFDPAKVPDLSFVHEACRTVAGVLRPGMLVILQSTTYPGTTVEVVQPILEESGLRAGEDFHLAFSPERVDPGNTTWTVHNTPKVVGGLSDEGAAHAEAILEAVMAGPGLVEVVSTPEAAEMCKLLENTYRAVNIALVNELAILAHEMGIDIWEVIDAAATKPFGFEAFYPGIGPGGHCIPVDPYYLSWKAREFDFQTKFIELAADTNLRMAPYVVSRILAFMNDRGQVLKGSRVLCLGASFKAGVSDTRNSRAVHVMELLESAGAVVDFVDTHVSQITLTSGERKVLPLDAVEWGSFDLVVALVKHPDWPVDEIAAAGVPVFDPVDALAGLPASQRERL